MDSSHANRALPNGLLDRTAIALSGLCLVHCVATVVFFGVLSSVGALLGNPLIHEIGLGVAILLGAMALGRGVMVHRKIMPAGVGGLGLGTMAGALTIPHGGMEAAYTIIGVGLLALAHFLNTRAYA
jgi:MerC mercury resistance protein